MTQKKDLTINQIVIVHYPDGSRYFARVKEKNLPGELDQDNISVQFLEHFDSDKRFLVGLDQVEI